MFKHLTAVDFHLENKPTALRSIWLHTEMDHVDAADASASWWQVRESRVQFRYDLGSGDRVIALTGVNISDGAWHVVSVSRHAHQVELWVDGGEGRMRVERDDRDGHRLVAVDGRRVNAGAEVTYRKYTSEPTRTRGLANSKYTVSYTHTRASQ